MRKVLKWLGILGGTLVGLAFLALTAIYYITETRLNQEYNIEVESLRIPTDQASIERGKHLVTTMGLCTDCHEENLAGAAWDDGPLLAKISVRNLTTGDGGAGSKFTDEDWIRAIRHGVGSDGKSLIAMPSNFYYRFSNADLGAIIAYLKQLPAVDNALPPTTIGPIGRLFILLDPSVLPAAIIDHDAPRPPEPVPGVTAEYGAYLATVCAVCHGQDLAGEEGAGGGMNLTPGGDLANWTEEDFIRSLRTGVTPEGETLDEELMPWKSIRQFSDDELKAIWLYLQSLPAVETPELSS